MAALFPTEINPYLLKFGEKTRHEDPTGMMLDSSTRMLYENKPVLIQLNNIRVLFGVLEYNTPQGNNLRRSTGIDVDHISFENYVDAFESIDAYIKDFSRVDKDSEYFSFIRKNDVGQRHLRVKIPGTRHDRSNIVMYVNGREFYKPPFDMLHTYMEHDTTASVILKMGDMWNSGNKYGISWQLQSISIDTSVFRND